MKFVSAPFSKFCETKCAESGWNSSAGEWMSFQMFPTKLEPDKSTSLLEVTVRSSGRLSLSTPGESELCELSQVEFHSLLVV